MLLFGIEGFSDKLNKQQCIKIYKGKNKYYIRIYVNWQLTQYKILNKDFDNIFKIINCYIDLGFNRYLFINELNNNSYIPKHIYVPW